jgi:hypothetical protein
MVHYPAAYHTYRCAKCLRRHLIALYLARSVANAAAASCWKRVGNAHRLHCGLPQCVPLAVRAAHGRGSVVPKCGRGGAARPLRCGLGPQRYRLHQVGAARGMLAGAAAAAAAAAGVMVGRLLIAPRAPQGLCRRGPYDDRVAEPGLSQQARVRDRCGERRSMSMKPDSTRSHARKMRTLSHRRCRP